MRLIFNLQTGQFEIVLVKKTKNVNGDIDFGNRGPSDLVIDFGNRDNDTSIVDSGDRIIIGNNV